MLVQNRKRYNNENYKSKHKAQKGPIGSRGGVVGGHIPEETLWMRSSPQTSNPHYSDSKSRILVKIKANVL